MITRLKKIIEHYDLSASTFADKIEVPRSSISHLLSGRNKASLDFVMKVVDTFKEVELNWLVYGKGKFPKLAEEVKKENQIQFSDKKTEMPPTLFSQTEQEVTKVSNTPFSENEKKNIKKIIVLNNDGTFEEYISK